LLTDRTWCVDCKQEYSLKVLKGSLFCPDCGKFLVVKPLDSAIVEPIVDKEFFVRNIYKNARIVDAPKNECDICFNRYGFTRLDNFGFKPCFPPVGSPDQGQVLFVGINPRCKRSSKDEDFYRHALKSEETFLQFSTNGRYKTSNGYWSRLFNDAHYGIHQRCLSEVIPGWTLGERSSVAELFMCGKESSVIFSGIENPLDDCICAKEYLSKYLDLVKPKIIVSFGGLPAQWFIEKFSNDIENNAKQLDTGFHQVNYRVNPCDDGIKKLHACFAQITLDSKASSQIIFSVHPSAWMTGEEKNKLLKTFVYIAKPLYV
jgi:DNA-directed RNA polymerase subunit RPC12/RpoP